jgi:hypothetical protein
VCFVFIWEQTATCATYSINWLVFITEMKSVYCAVRTESLNKADCASSLNGQCNFTLSLIIIIIIIIIKVPEHNLFKQLLLLQLYNSLWVLACSIISFHCFLSCALCFEFFTLIFLRSFLASSSHLNLGLPFGLVAYGFHLYIVFVTLSFGILSTCPNQLNLLLLICLTIFSYLIAFSCSSFYSNNTQWISRPLSSKMFRVFCLLLPPRSTVRSQHAWRAHTRMHTHKRPHYTYTPT